MCKLECIGKDGTPTCPVWGVGVTPAKLDASFFSANPTDYVVTTRLGFGFAFDVRLAESLLIIAYVSITIFLQSQAYSKHGSKQGVPPR